MKTALPITAMWIGIVYVAKTSPETAIVLAIIAFLSTIAIVA